MADRHRHRAASHDRQHEIESAQGFYAASGEPGTAERGTEEDDHDPAEPAWADTDAKGAMCGRCECQPPGVVR